jgi:hypothetical protein
MTDVKSALERLAQVVLGGQPYTAYRGKPPPGTPTLKDDIATLIAEVRRRPDEVEYDFPAIITAVDGIGPCVEVVDGVTGEVITGVLEVNQTEGTLKRFADDARGPADTVVEKRFFTVRWTKEAPELLKSEYVKGA